MKCLACKVSCASERYYTLYNGPSDNRSRDVRGHFFSVRCSRMKIKQARLGNRCGRKRPQCSARGCQPMMSLKLRCPRYKEPVITRYELKI
ncbi:hypothetical protein AG1IA_02314 [Rhizoctonia solani AG-1 IA]|uniref:Uncharacterized protein n=1 Tax=Thanatephorus cucumeris (strain AG1-IA) TaxID=983506 RepID=L8X009_THACA|nr:hypothetical protein AG1IA_02314 [Rhizoctonia solani AG-1 IA]